MNRFADYDRKHARPAYLIYRYKGEIRVKKGRAGRVFYPDYNPHIWNTNCPTEFNKVTSAGRILVRTEDEIPEAVEMLRNHYRSKVNSVQHTVDVSIKNIMNCIEKNECINVM